MTKLGRPPRDEKQRFWGKVRKTDGCWLWTGGPYSFNEYGVFYKRAIEGRSKGISSHRYSYEFVKGQIPEGTVLHHKCRNKRCVNPDHLEPVTSQQNTIADKDMIAVKSAWGRFRKRQ